MSEKFLDKVYETEGEEATRELYNAWSKSYEQEVGAQGYKTPARLADALAVCLEDKSRPILDYGCGTGLGGAELAARGFTALDGTDPAEEMLAEARAKGVYRSLVTLDLSKPLPFHLGEYAAIAAIGVISTGAGPASLMGVLMDLLDPGGLLAFSLNDHALDDPSYPAGVEALQAAGHITRIADYGEHLPGLDLKSMVYVFEKA